MTPAPRARRGHGRKRPRPRGRRRRPKGRKARAPHSAKVSGDFWGDASKLPSTETIAINPDPSALSRSLGRPPFAGHEAASEYYLRTVYDNAAMLAEVLATAGDLLAESPDDSDTPDT